MSLQIQKILGDIFTKENVAYNNSLVTVLSVELSRDIRLATVFLSIFNSNEDLVELTFKQIIGNKKNIRYKMGNRLQAKYVPELKFELDYSLKKYDEINRLLKK